MDNKVLDCVLNKNDINENCDDFENLKDEGIIVPVQFDETNYILKKELQELHSMNNKILTYVIAFSMNCNMKCQYCFQPDDIKNKEINDNTLANLINFVKEQLLKNKVEFFLVTWFGGEPMLSYDKIIEFCNEIVPFCKENKVKFQSSMITNGLLMTKERSLVLKEKCNLKTVQITLDGLEEYYCNVKRVKPEVFKQVI